MTRLVSLAALAACLSACAAAPSADSGTRADIFLTPDTTLVQGVVPSNTTLDGMLRGHGMAAAAVAGVISAARQVFDPRRLRSSQPFRLVTSLDGALRQFEYEIDAASFLRVAPAAIGSDNLRAEVLPIPRTLEQASAAGTIDEDTPSLFQAMASAGEGAELTIALAQIFAGEIDFNTELQPGDRFTLAYDRYRRQDRADRPVTYGDIHAAEFQNDGRLLRAIRFTPPGGQPGYFDEQGRSLRRFFLRSPLKFEPRITSRYSLRRMHPVLQTARAHRGVDYGAPTGAPVVAVSSGTVVSATYDDTNGRMVRLRHASGYQSYYLHLSAFAAGVRAGARVEQGQTIGLVGSTGLATGPHLHYGLQKNGGWVDPLREHRNMPPGDPVPAAAMDAFRDTRDRALAQLSYN
ncbi:MAG: M23 family metallopeptidase [Acidimicrobiia bacterium]|nr:M23 family metallopeptidase [Acidimicrobiia bacterium]